MCSVVASLNEFRDLVTQEERLDALLQIFTLTLTLTLTLHDHKLRVNQIRRNRGGTEEEEGRTLVEMQGVTKRRLDACLSKDVRSTSKCQSRSLAAKDMDQESRRKENTRFRDRRFTERVPL